MKKVRELTQEKKDQFFKLALMDEIFIYSAQLTFGQVVTFAKAEGIELKHCGTNSIYGPFTCKVIAFNDARSMFKRELKKLFATYGIEYKTGNKIHVDNFPALADRIYDLKFKQ